MSQIKKLSFTCPECGTHKLTADRTEWIQQLVVEQVDISEEVYMSQMVEEKEYLCDSTITNIICDNCGFLVVEYNEEKEEDLGELLLNWLEDHNMLEDVEDPN